MQIRNIVLHALMLGALSTGALRAEAASVAWTRYVNPRFGTSAEVPAGFVAQPPPENEDGRTFASPDGGGEIRIYASNGPSVVTESFRAYETWTAEAEVESGWTITYRARGKGWFALSGTRGESVVYQKAVAGCRGSVAHHVWISYPAGQKSRYDPIVARLGRSLRVGGRAAC